MADKDIQIKLDLLINNADAASSVKEVRGAIKDLQSALINLDEGSEEFIRASKKAGELQDKVADVKDSIKSFNNSPIENVTNSFSLLGQKIKNLDFKGAKQQFQNLQSSTSALAKSFLGIQEGAGFASISMKGLGKAFAATGIGLFVIAVVALITNFDKLKSAGGILGSALKSLGDVVSSVVGFFTKLSDAIGLTAIESKKAADQQIEDQNRVLDNIKTDYEFRIALAKAYGKDTKKLELQSAEEQLAILKGQADKNKDIIDGIAKFNKATYDKMSAADKARADQKQKAFEDTEEGKKAKEKADKIKALEQGIAIIKAQIETQSIEDSKKAGEKAVETSRKSLEKQIQLLKDSNELRTKQQVDGSLEELKAREDGNQKIIDFYNKNKSQLVNLQIVTETQRKLVIQNALDDSLQANKKYYDGLEKACQEGEDKITKEKKDAADKQIKDQKELDDISKKNFIDGENLKDDLGKASIIRAGDNLKKATEAEIQYNKDRIDRYTNYGEFELEQLGITLGAKELAIGESNKRIKELNDILQQDLFNESKKALDEYNQQLQAVAQNLGGVAGSVLSGFGNIATSLGNSLQNYQARVKDFIDSGKNGMSEATAEILAGVEAGLDAANELVGTIGSALAEKSNERIAAVQSEKEAQIAALEEQNRRGLISDEQLAKGKDKINQDAYKKDLALRRKAFQQQKAIQIVQAVIGTAQGIVSALANPFPLNIVMAALAGVTGAVNIGLIAAQKFPEGGSAPSSSTPSTPSASAEGLVNATSPNQFVPPQFQSIGDNRFSKGGEGNMFVLVDDINRGQRKVSVIEDRSTVL